MAKALVIRETGGPSVMRWEDVAVGDPSPGKVRLRRFERQGQYPSQSDLCAAGRRALPPGHGGAQNHRLVGADPVGVSRRACDSVSS